MSAQKSVQQEEKDINSIQQMNLRIEIMIEFMVFWNLYKWG